MIAGLAKRLVDQFELFADQSTSRPADVEQDAVDSPRRSSSRALGTRAKRP
jgi:hypothetical protein